MTVIDTGAVNEGIGKLLSQHNNVRYDNRGKEEKKEGGDILVIDIQKAFVKGKYAYC